MRTYRDGTLSLTNASPVIVGVGTQFVANVSIGDMIVIENGQCLEVITVTDDTHITVDAPAKQTGSFKYAALRFVTAVNFRDLSLKIEQFLFDRQQSLNQFSDWSAGTKTGGPNGDGKYPMTDRLGVTRMFACPELLAFGYEDSAAQAAAAATSATNAAASATSASSSATSATSSKNAAATSATNAATSATNAATSETNALASKNSAATSATTATTKASEASTSATNAAASATAAAGSASSASTSATTATTKASEASTSAATATTKASEASTSATNAATSATAANTSKNAAATSETNAAASATAANTSKNTAATSATTATTQATAAATSATNAATSETNAAASATAAASSASAAATSKTGADSSKNAAASSATAAAASATAAGTAETNALASKNAAATSETNALASKNAAATSATNAATSATNAASSASTATTKASEAATSASNAAASAQSAADSAAQASASIGTRLSSIAQAVMAVNDILISDSATTMTKLSTGAYGRTFLSMPDLASARTSLGLTAPFSSVTTTVDFNTLVTTGWQPFLYSASGANAPTGAAGGGVAWWYVHVNNYQNTSTVLQVAYPYGTGANAKGRIAWRNLYSGAWTDWSYVATTNDLGTAAALNVTTSNSDTTANRLLKVGDFGIGSTGAIAPPNNNLSDVSVTGTYQITSATTNGPAGAGSGSICLHLAWSTTAAHQIVVAYSAARSFWRTKNSGTWGAWNEYATKDDLGTAAAATITTSQQDLTDGRLLKVGDYGLGTAIQLAGGSNLNTLLVPGTYAFTSGSALVNSPTPAIAQYVTVIGRNSYPYQEVRPIYGTGVWYRSAKVASPTTAAADWNAWQKYVVPGDYGIGGASVQETSDMNTIQYSGFYSTTSTTLNVPIGQGTGTAQGHVIHNQHLNPLYASQTWTSLYTGATYSRIRYNGTWTAWALSTNVGDYGVGLTGGTTNLIPVGTDLNDMKTGGLYGQNANANATLALNYPVILAGTLLVITAASSIVTQVYTIYNTGRSYTRGYYAGTWSAWLETINSTYSGVNNTGISEQTSTVAQPWTGNRFARWAYAAVDGPGGYAVGLDMGYASNRRMQICINTGGVFSYRYSDTPDTNAGWKTVTNEQSFTATGLALRSASNAEAARGTLGLTDLAITTPAALPFINLMSDSGRFSGKMNPLQYNVSTTFSVSPFFAVYNGGVWSEGGKYIYNNTNGGGTGGSMTEPVTSWLNACGRGATTSRYGIEFFIGTYTCGTGTLTGSTYNSVTRYLITTNGSRALYQFDQACTFSTWIRVRSGSVHSNLGMYVNGVYQDPGYVLLPAAGWVHIRISQKVAAGYNNAFPNLYAAASSVIDFALPGFFAGGIDTGIQTSPLGTINELVA